MKSIKMGDVIYMDRSDELIQVVSAQIEPCLIYYWSSAYPKEIGTKRCRTSDAWIIFEYGMKVGDNVGRPVFRVAERQEK